MDKEKLDYFRHKRTPEQFYQDWKDGKAKERAIVKKLDEHFWTEYPDDDVFGEIKPYKEDCIIGYGDFQMKIEIKYNKAYVTNFTQLTANQVDKGIDQNIFTIMVSHKRIAFFNPRDKLKLIEKGYNTKPCYLFKVKEWFTSFEDLKTNILDNYAKTY